MITYQDRVTPVRLGDRVERRIWFRKHGGRVVYVPGVSAANPNMEQDGLRWVGVRLDEGGFISVVVDPTEQCLKGRVRFVRHDEDPVQELGPDEDPHGEDSFAAPF